MRHFGGSPLRGPERAEIAARIRDAREAVEGEVTTQNDPAVGKYPLAAATLGLLLAGTFMPSPLYELYRRVWGLTPLEISFVFAIYVSTLIPALLFLGGLSDTLGRRQTLLIAIAFSAAGSLVFAFATGMWSLAAARVLQGIAVGMGTGTATAAVRDWMPEAMRPRAGAVAILGVGVGSSAGAIVGGALAQYAPFPTTLPYLVHVALLAMLAAALATIPSRAPAGAARPRGLPAIPRAIRRPFYLVSLESFVGWGAIAIFVSLLPSFLARSLGVQNLLVGAAVVTGVQLGMIAASFAGRRFANRTAIVVAMLALGCGMWLLLAAVPLRAYALIALATFVVGFGGGLSYLAALNVVNALAEPDRRAELNSALLVACYFGFSIPALGVGFAANRFGLYAAIVGAAVALGALAVAAMIATTPANLVARGDDRSEPAMRS